MRSHGVGMNKTRENRAPVVGLFATCLVDLLRPGIGFASAALLQQAGCRVEVPPSQTCCGQPAYNSGAQTDTRSIARKVISTFENFDYVVAPSGSCAGMIKLHYPKILKDDPQWALRAARLARKTFELTQFLSDEIKMAELAVSSQMTATYHDSCSGLRELSIKQQPRKLLDQVQGVCLKEGKQAERCCGFGGLFCVKYGDISTGIVDEKIDDLQATGAQVVLGGDLGCLLNIAGRLKRLGSPIQVRHVAEVLAGITDLPAISEPLKIKN